MVTIVCLSSHLSAQQTPIGSWREHLPYHSAIAVQEAPDKIYCATPYSVFTVDKAEQSLEKLSKMNRLSDVGISAMRFDSALNKLVIAYTNGNMDILNGNETHNIPDFFFLQTAFSKSTRQIYVQNHAAYLATSMGILVLNEDRYEISGNWVIGHGGDTVNVNSIVVFRDTLYAATEEGLKFIPQSVSDPADFHNWQNISINTLTGPVAEVFTWNNQLYSQKNDSLFANLSGNWQFFYADGWKINGVNISSGKLLINESQNSSGRVIELTGAAQIQQVIQSANGKGNPQQAIFSGNEYWVADSLNGLFTFSNNSAQAIIPNSPQSVSTGELTISGNTLWVASGGVDADWNPLNNKNGLFKFSGDNWTNYTPALFPAFDSLPDLLTVSVDATNRSSWAGSFGGGLAQVSTDNSIHILKEGSALSSPPVSAASYQIAGSCFDQHNNLWVSRFGAANELVVIKKDGTSQSFSIPFPLANNAVSQLLVDDYDQVWIISPQGNGLICFNHGVDLSNPGDDQWKYFRYGQGSGNLPDSNVNCIAKDKSGTIWVGTKNGIGIIQCAQTLFSPQNSCEAILPVVQYDNFAGYLFFNEQVQTIAVDGADRKWIGTKNGVWLVTTDAAKIVYRFTAETSPLLDNDVKKIAVDPGSGEVYFETAKGICSFRSTATEGGPANSTAFAFPNPVPPGYAGTIAIRGLADNTIIKITELNGRLVYQTRSLGGQAVWNGKDYLGRTISTGVYLVLASKDNGQEQAITKIVFIKK